MGIGPCTGHCCGQWGQGASSGLQRVRATIAWHTCGTRANNMFQHIGTEDYIGVIWVLGSWLYSQVYLAIYPMAIHNYTWLKNGIRDVGSIADFKYEI